MHRSETYEQSCCLDCGNEVHETRDRTYAVLEIGVLCFDCAVRRGGRYDETEEHWDIPPSLEGLASAEEPMARVWK